MGIYKGKYATSEQIAEIERLAADGHFEALIAYGKDCVHGYKQNLTNACWAAVGLGFGVALLWDGIDKLVKMTRKDSKEPEENVQNE